MNINNLAIHLNQISITFLTGTPCANRFGSEYMCNGWAAAGQCITRWMLKNCAKSCNVCTDITSAVPATVSTLAEHTASSRTIPPPLSTRSSLKDILSLRPTSITVTVPNYKESTFLSIPPEDTVSPTKYINDDDDIERSTTSDIEKITTSEFPDTDTGSAAGKQPNDAHSSILNENTINSESTMTPVITRQTFENHDHEQQIPPHMSHYLDNSTMAMHHRQHRSLRNGNTEDKTLESNWPSKRTKSGTT